MLNDIQFLTLNELVTLQTNKIINQKDPDIPYIGLEHIAQNEPILLGTAPSNTSASVNSIFKYGDILFGKLRPNLRKSLQVHFDGYCSTDILVFRPRLEFSSAFISKVFQHESVFEEAVSTAEGTKMPRTSWYKLKNLRVFVPVYVEQCNIAKILDTIDTQIQQTEKLIAKLKQVKIGLLHDLLTRGIDENGDVRDPLAHPEQFKMSALGRIPMGWEIDTLLKHISLPSGQINPKEYPYCDWPLIAPDHIEAESGRLLKVETAAQQNAISGKYSFQSGDVLYSKIRPYLKKAILADQIGLCSADMYPLRSKQTLLPRFLLAVILGEHFSQFAIAVSMRSGFPKINRDELGEYKAILPSYQEQIRISKVIEAHDTRITTEEAHLHKLKQIKKGLMHDLLTGRVRVPQVVLEGG